MINREKFLQTAGSVLKHAMCSKREGSGALCGRDPAVLGLYSVAAHAPYPAGQPRAHTIVLAPGRAPFLCISELRSAVEMGGNALTGRGAAYWQPSGRPWVVFARTELSGLQ